ncbi:NUDIX hydrolase [Candidatus Macondimonas diazotrophica]|uniref:NUDIX hydrolase n=2 Tax=Candidatus Macondimonas diazotrophica TaxID=2305248 RepID=A0A4Z0F9Q2_9GAMM|nr:NUDIX hydrolase [Candidatus Macondimonas diazotrophica]TFZ82317.1 NUDIX hydrolase [Candidatus Macondimonas diazotrophica]
MPMDVRTPPVAVDLIIEMTDRSEPSIVLVARRYPPLGWALPGGFVDVGETLPEAARREAKEETGLSVTLKALLGCYSDPSRDPRGHTVSAVYVGTASGMPQGADDARDAAVFTRANLPDLAFDHARIVADYFEFYRAGRPVPLD